ncbi:MAG TPA: hypothetical protein VGA73_11260 [Candidatus Binatia bacterium]
MRQWMTVLGCLALLSAAGCGKDEKSSAERDAEVKRAMQQGADAEKKMYEGMQKGVENAEKKVEEKK